ncbi:MAG: lysoplasmalogenase family protein, partial [Bacteroidota bacterium]|nr:lysoplasmalogenase family protein [Bacteroidota bacterium]
MFQHRDQFNFLIGLSGYFIAVLCYMMAFIHNIADVGGDERLWIPSMIGLGLLGFGFLFASRLVPYLDDSLSIPILVYAIAMIGMAIAAGFRYGRTFVR